MESELQNSQQFSSPNFIDPNVLAKNQTTRKKEEKKKKKVRAAGYHGIENRKQKQQAQSIFSNLINSNDVADMTPPLDLTGSCLSYFLGQGMSAILVSVPRLSVSYICFKFRVKCENSLCRSICPLLLRHHYSHSSCPGILDGLNLATDLLRGKAVKSSLADDNEDGEEGCQSQHGRLKLPEQMFFHENRAAAEQEEEEKLVPSLE